jgi:hypothetical protein
VERHTVHQHGSWLGGFGWLGHGFRLLQFSTMTSADDVRTVEVCPSSPSLRGEGAAGGCEAAGSKKPEV